MIHDLQGPQNTLLNYLRLPYFTRGGSCFLHKTFTQIFLHLFYIFYTITMLFFLINFKQKIFCFGTS